jgi:hypothetical protein
MKFLIDYRSIKSHEIIQFEATFQDGLIPSSGRKSTIYLQHNSSIIQHKTYTYLLIVIVETKIVTLSLSVT